MTIEDLKRHWQDEAEQAGRIGEWCWTCDKAAVDRCVEGKHNFVQPGTTPLEVAERRAGELEGVLSELREYVRAHICPQGGDIDAERLAIRAARVVVKRIDATLAGKVMG